MAAAGDRIAALALFCAACTSINATQATFEGTRWRVISINGHPTPPSDRFRMEFGRVGFAARFGCNTASAPYVVQGRFLRPGMTVLTQAACIETPAADIPTMTWERWGSDVVTHPMRMSWISSRRLVLSNAAGSLELDLKR